MLPPHLQDSPLQLLTDQRVQQFQQPVRTMYLPVRPPVQLRMQGQVPALPMPGLLTRSKPLPQEQPALPEHSQALKSLRLIRLNLMLRSFCRCSRSAR